jgi:hypothetical protein
VSSRFVYDGRRRRLAVMLAAVLPVLLVAPAGPVSAGPAGPARVGPARVGPARVGPAVAALAASGSFVDTFAGSPNAHPFYGLNVALDPPRQTGTAGQVPYTRVSGLWNSAKPPASWYVQANHPAHPNKLLFTSGTSAIMLNAPVSADQAGRYTIATTLDPEVGSGSHGDWGSIVLSRSRHSTGYVTNGDVDLALTVASTGSLALYHAGTAFWTGSVAAADSYAVSLTVTTGTGTEPKGVELVVNGSRFTSTDPQSVKAWPSTPYLFLGAYLSAPDRKTTFGSGRPGEGLSVSNVDTYPMSSAKPLVDTFDNAINTDPGYGLNDGIGQRQPTVATSDYSRVSGLWNSTRPPDSWYSQVNHSAYPNRLSMWLGPSAVRVNKPTAADLERAYTVHVVVDPVTADTSSGDWASVIVSGSGAGRGWPVSSDVDLGLTVRSNGGLQLYQKGNPTWATEQTVSPRTDGSFDVTVTVRTDVQQATISVNGRTFPVTTRDALPRMGYVYLGQYTQTTTEVSTFDDLRISSLGGLNYNGFFSIMHPDAPNNGVDHSGEVSDFTNMNVYLNHPDTGFLDYCGPASCIVYTGYDQFVCADNWCRLNPDAQTNLEKFKARIGANLSKVAAVMMRDELYADTLMVEPADVQRAVTQLRTLYPGKIVALNLSGPSIRRIQPGEIPADIDWVGFDWYCQGPDVTSSLLDRLKNQLTTAYQRVFVDPEAADVAECAGRSDAYLAASQTMYENLANRDPRVVYLMHFGWWLFAEGGSMSPFSSLPQTAAALRGVGQRISGR